jgi:hypothetical protein
VDIAVRAGESRLVRSDDGVIFQPVEAVLVEGVWLVGHNTQQPAKKLV